MTQSSRAEIPTDPTYTPTHNKATWSRPRSFWSTLCGQGPWVLRKAGTQQETLKGGQE